VNLIIGLSAFLQSEFSPTPAGRKAGLVNLGSKIHRLELSVLPVLAGKNHPYNGSQEVKLSLFCLGLFTLICVPVITMAKDVTCNFEGDVNF
jgi:hypothetical protein